MSQRIGLLGKIYRKPLSFFTIEYGGFRFQFSRKAQGPEPEARLARGLESSWRSVFRQKVAFLFLNINLICRCCMSFKIFF